MDKENIVFEESDFTEEELAILRLAFKVTETILESERIDRYDVDRVNAFYSLKNKLGIYDLVD